MRALVTGGDGFVGEHLICHLLSRDVDVTASAVALPPDRSTMTFEQAAEVDWKVADVLDHAALYRLVAAVRPDHIYHLAGFASGARAREEAERAMRVNAGGTVNLLEAIVSAREDFPDLDPRTLIMGSGEAYGDAIRKGHPAREDSQLCPCSPYGLSKACQELAAHTYRRASGLRTIVARPFNLLGPGQKADFVVPSFCAQVAAIAGERAEPVLRVGNLDVERDFLDVRDAVRGFRAIMELERPDVSYNVCSGRAVSIRTILSWILSEAGVEAEIRVDPDRVRPDEPEWLAGDPSRLREQAGWTPEGDVEEAVRRTYRWIEASTRS